MTPIDPDAVEHIPPEAVSTYTKLAAAYGQPYYRSVADDVTARLEPGDRLLDAGTGPGFLPIMIAERVNSARIYAFDFTPELVRYGYDEARRRGVDEIVSFFVADCYAIPSPARSYSHLLSTGVIHSLDDPVSVLDEFYRVLEPGGVAWVFDPVIMDVPDEPDIELTEHERDVFEAYGVATGDEERPLSMSRVEEIVTDSSFGEAVIEEGDRGDVRVFLTRGTR